MIGDILNSVMQECRAKLKGTGGTVILKTDYKSDKLPSYTMPFLLVELLGDEDSYQYPGGLTRVDWRFALNCYHNMPDPTIDDDSGFSRYLLDVIDDIRRHFQNGIWLNTTVTPIMDDILNNYNFKFTLSGIQQADALEHDGTIMGYRIVFDSVALDNQTDENPLSSAPLATVTEVNNPPFN